ncbi:unnamed protein product [Calypogeia fissa]
MAGGQKEGQEPPCGTEALALLNCVAAKPYDESRCIALLSILRSCVERKNVQRFAIDNEGQKAVKGASDEEKSSS